MIPGSIILSQNLKAEYKVETPCITKVKKIQENFQRERWWWQFFKGGRDWKRPIINYLGKGLTVNSVSYSTCWPTNWNRQFTPNAETYCRNKCFFRECSSTFGHPHRWNHQKIRFWCNINLLFNINLTPCDYCLFGSLKNALRGCQFAMNEKVQEAILG